MPNDPDLSHVLAEPEPIPTSGRESVLDRLVARTEVRDDGCWMWTGALGQGWWADTGYGRMGIGKTVYRTHLLAYRTLVGPIPEGLELDHLCNNPACLNPDHLEPVTHQENGRRAALRRWHPEGNH